LLNQKTTCTIGSNNFEVEFIQKGIKEYSQSMMGNNNFWLKSEILKDMPKYVKNATCVGKKASDATHNTRKQTVRLKEHTEDFYYFPITLPNGDNCYLHLGKYKQQWGGNFYFYTITKNIPENVIPI
jgi:hypothetical protein